MLYLAYQAQADLMFPIRAVAQTSLDFINAFAAPAQNRVLRNLTAAYELVTRAGLTHTRPPYGIASVKVGNRDVAVTEEPLDVTPFGTLLHFKKDLAVAQPKVLVVAPLSGHFATLLRSLVRTMLPDHDVCITDWHNARDVGIEHGRFGYDEYVAHLIRWFEKLGNPVHSVAVCQPCVQVLTAASVMSQAGNPDRPRSITLMAGPIDTRINPTKVNELAMGKSIEWFERNLIARVPIRYPGAGRRVYPGFMQLTAFMSMNIDRHRKAHLDLYEHLARGDHQKAKVTKEFYDEYFAVLDLAAEFYLETVQWIFQEARLARGVLDYRGRRVDPGAIRRMALLTVEGERDDICSLGQTSAAHDLCKGLKPFMKRHHMQAGVGHYGVFSGRRWEEQVYPIVRNVILSSE
ncbi:MAG: polyhydroxyalkanoate depolymerase [Hyphomicrobiaceae bacterium]|nr:polyhydroxyalkanoate depolymerase [Hyphomicrobiaceae bacterium]